MRLRRPLSVFALAIALASTAACELDKGTMLAPSESTLGLATSASFLPINQSATITVTVRTLDGKAVPDGTEVVLTASLGNLAQRKVRVTGGSANVSYRAGAQVGVERIQASSGSASATLDIPIGSGSIARIMLASNPTTLPAAGGNADLTAWAFTTDGQPVSGVPVQFKTTSGSIIPSDPVITNAEGSARARLQASESTTVRASALSFASDEIQVAVRKPVQLTLAANPAAPIAGQVVTFTVTATEDGKPARGASRIEFGNGETAHLGQINGTATATHTFSEGSYNVTAYLVDEDAGEVRETVRVEVSKVSTPPPGPISTGDAIDPRSIRWLSPASTDVTNWTVTSTITSVDIRGDDICINHTKSGQWPLVSIDENPPNIEGNPMIVVNIGGQWYGAGFDWFGQGRTCKHMRADEYGRDQIRVAPLDGSWPGPRSGDMIGLLVSTPSSDRIPVRSLNERSNIVLVRWP